MSIIETKIDRFDGGMINDPREKALGVSRVLKNFYNDDRHRLIPFRDMVCDAVTEANLDTYKICQITDTGTNLYGLGVESGVTRVQIYQKVTPTDVTSAWTTSTSAFDAGGFGGARNENIFLYYKKQDCLYGGNAVGIWKYNITSHVFTYNDYTTYVPSNVQGVVHSKDDILYMASANLLLKNDAGSWSVALTLPNNVTIAALAEYNNYLAIGCNKVGGGSIVYLWDRNSSFTTLAESINWGTSTIAWIQNLGGTLMTGSYTGSYTGSLYPRLLISYYSGSSSNNLFSFTTTGVTMKNAVQKVDNKIYFLAEVTLNGVFHSGLFRIQKNADGSMIFAFDRYPRNNVDMVSSGKLKGFYIYGDYVLIAYLNPTGSTYTVWRTNDQASFTAQSIYESPIINNFDSGTVKKLIGITVTTEPMPVAGSITLNYKKDGGSWILIFTNTTDNAISKSATKLPTSVTFGSYKELELQLISTGGAVPTGIQFKEETVDKKSY